MAIQQLIIHLTSSNVRNKNNHATVMESCFRYPILTIPNLIFTKKFKNNDYLVTLSSVQ